MTENNVMSKWAAKEQNLISAQYTKHILFDIIYLKKTAQDWDTEWTLMILQYTTEF